MSRRTRANSVSTSLQENQQQMSQQATQEQTSVMGPPPVPTTSIINPATGNVVATTSVPGRIPEEIEEKYNKLKRKYQELEEKHKETVLQLQRSGERNIKLKDERSALMDRIAELQGDITRTGPSVDLFGPQPSSSAYSKAMISNRARQAFEANLLEAANEAQMEDIDTDPAVNSNHIGPASRQRVEQQQKERHDEETSVTVKEGTPATFAAPPKKTPVRRTKKQAQANRDSSTPSASAPPGPGSSSTSVFSTTSPFTTSARKIILKPPVPPAAETPVDTPESGSPSSMAIDIPHISQLQVQQTGGYPADVTMGDNSSSDPNTNSRFQGNHSFREAPPKPDPPNPGQSFRDDGGGGGVIADREPHSLSPSHSFREALPDPERDKPLGGGREGSFHGYGMDELKLLEELGEVNQQDDFTVPIDPYEALPEYTAPALVHDAYSTPVSLSPVTPTHVPTLPLINARSFTTIHPSVFYLDLHNQPEVKHEYSQLQHAQGEVTSMLFNRGEREDQAPALIPPIPRNPGGSPNLPWNFGFFTLESLGYINTREGFHSSRYIYPTGYTIVRRFLSTSNPYQRTFYRCTILEGPEGPQFQMMPADNPHQTTVANSADEAWNAIERAAKGLRGAMVSPTRVQGPLTPVRGRAGSDGGLVSGEEFFGLERAEVRKMIQELAGAAQLAAGVGGEYLWTEYVEGG